MKQLSEWSKERQKERKRMKKRERETGRGVELEIHLESDIDNKALCFHTKELLQLACSMQFHLYCTVR